MRAIFAFITVRVKISLRSQVILSVYDKKTY
jgi:hypothetical protein